MHHLYIVTDPLRLQANTLKIGIHKGDLTSLRQRYLTAIPQLIVCEFIACPAARECERLILNLLDGRRLPNDEGNKSEWIQFPFEKLRQCVSDIAGQARKWAAFDQPNFSEDPISSPMCEKVTATNFAEKFPACPTSHELGDSARSDKGTSLSDSALLSIPDDLLLKLSEKINLHGLCGSPCREGVFRLRWKSPDRKLQSQSIGPYKFSYPTYMIEYMGQMMSSLAKKLGKWKRGNQRERAKWTHVVDPSVHVAKCVYLLSAGDTEQKCEGKIATETTTMPMVETARNIIIPPLREARTAIPSVEPRHHTATQTLGGGIDLQRSTGAGDYSLKVNITADVTHPKIFRGKQDVHLNVTSQSHPKGIRSGFNASTWKFNQHLRTSCTTVGYDGSVQISTAL